MEKNYDIIIIGAGSIGLPLAYELAGEGFKTLILDKAPTFGQGENKAAIGGIRATHTEESKIYICQESIEIFSNWKNDHNFDLGWKRGGYTYPAYTQELKDTLQDQVKLQKEFGLNIDYVDRDTIMELVPQINPDGLLGGTFSPDDGSASPMQSAVAFYLRAKELGADFRFNQTVTGFNVRNNRILSVRTNENTFFSKIIINCTGSYAGNVGNLLGLNIPVKPDCHEAGITEPVRSFFKPMIVDMRKTQDSSNFYFYQSETGQIVFCITPDPPIFGLSRKSTSEFLPMVSKRMIELYPRLMNIRVRRVWRGQYPNTPDGFPIIDFNKDIEDLINVVGMCGQGFMMGPGIARVIKRKLINKTNQKDLIILDKLRIDREYSGKEQFK